MFWYYDSTMLLLIPAMLVTLWAEFRVKSAYSKYSQIASARGITAVEMVTRLLHSEGIYDVAIEQIGGNMTDHYDPTSKTLRLSAGVARSSSLAALGIAAHECGHVLQHRDAYGPLVLRTAAVPMVNIGSRLSWPMFLLGFVLSWDPLITVGIVLFALTVLFSLITMPVEFNASRRATAALEGGGFLTSGEIDGAKKVLSAAAMTYVAAAFTAVMQLVRLLTIANRRRD